MNGYLEEGKQYYKACLVIHEKKGISIEKNLLLTYGKLKD
jgi:hypothetical protein